jgi:integrase/recombinase XerD
VLVRLAQQRLHPAPAVRTLDERDAPMSSPLRDSLEHERGTSARRRPGRLAARHAFFPVASRRAPRHSGVIPRVLALPRKRDDRTPSACLPVAERDTLLAAPDQRPWAGRRDRPWLLVAVQTGRRVSEWIGLCWQHIAVGSGAQVRCHGTGRTARCTPVRHDAITA